MREAGWEYCQCIAVGLAFDIAGADKKLESIAMKEGTSVSEIFRRAIDAYNSNIATDIIDPELLNLVSARVKTALADTKKINQKLQNSLKTLDHDQRLSKLESF